MLSVVADEATQAELRMDLDGLAREGARRMLAAALEAEVLPYLHGLSTGDFVRPWRRSSALERGCRRRSSPA